MTGKTGGNPEIKGRMRNECTRHEAGSREHVQLVLPVVENSCFLVRVVAQDYSGV